MPTLYFKNAMGQLWAHPDGCAVLRYQAAPRTLSEVHAMLLETGRLLQLKGWHKTLSDQRQLTPLTPDEQELILHYWQTRKIALGPAIIAVLLAHDVFTRLSFSQVRHQAEGALLYRTFEQEAEAMAWLRHTA
ncbi:PIN domain-containing protein [Hymenobacter crusticola]|nr:hypothetical protein [Hymenobacter crusticola]